MMFLFTENNLMGSKAIRWALGEPMSHFAIVFDERPEGYGIVFQSKFTGVQFDWWNNFKSHNTIIRSLKPKASDLYDEERVYQSIVQRFYGHPYDYRAFCAFGYYAMRRKITGTPIPVCPSLGANGSFLCTEIAQGLKEFCPNYVPKAFEGGLVSPYDLYKNMRESPDLGEVSP